MTSLATFAKDFEAHLTATMSNQQARQVFIQQAQEQAMQNNFDFAKVVLNGLLTLNRGGKKIAEDVEEYLLAHGPYNIKRDDNEGYTVKKAKTKKPFVPMEIAYYVFDPDTGKKKAPKQPKPVTAEKIWKLFEKASAEEKAKFVGMLNEEARRIQEAA